MIRSLIIDDEDQSRVALKGKLNLFCPEVEVIGEAAGVEPGLELIMEQSPDLVFLDINLAGENAFDLLDRLQEGLEEHAKQPEIIFITAHDEYALKAIKFSALDYLLKPVDAEDLVKAVRKLEEKTGKGPVGLQVLIENIRQASDSPKKIVVPTSDGMHVIKVSDILRCESSSNYTNFIIRGQKNLLASKTLKEFDILLAPYNFERIHKSHLVNVNYIKRYVQTDGGYVIMEDDSRIPVANRKKDALLKLLKSL